MFGGEEEGCRRGTSLGVAAGGSFSSPLLLFLHLLIIRVPTFQLLKNQDVYHRLGDLDIINITRNKRILQWFGPSFDMIESSESNKNWFNREPYACIERFCCTYTSIMHICLYRVKIKYYRYETRQSNVPTVPHLVDLRLIWYDRIIRFWRKWTLSRALGMYFRCMVDDALTRRPVPCVRHHQQK